MQPPKHAVYQSIVVVTKWTDSNRIWNKRFLHDDLTMEEVSSLHKGWAKPASVRSRVALSPLPSGFSWAWPFFFFFICEGQTLKGVQKDRQKLGPFCWLQSLCRGWPHPPRWPVSALEQSRILGPTHTSCHCCLPHRPGTDTAHCTAWTEHSNSATFNWPTIETSAWKMDISPTTSHSTGRLCITPVLVFIVVPLLLLLLLLPPPPLLLSSLFMFLSPLSLLCRVYTVFDVSPFLPDVMFWVELMFFPSKLVMTPVSYTCSSSTLLLHAQEATEAIYIHALPAEFTTENNYFRGYSFCCVRVLLSQSQDIKWCLFSACLWFVNINNWLLPMWTSPALL